MWFASNTDYADNYSDKDRCTCHKCKGEGKIYINEMGENLTYEMWLAAGADPIDVEICENCNGEGEIDAEQATWFDLNEERVMNRKFYGT